MELAALARLLQRMEEDRVNIGQARALRLELTRLAAFEQIAESARAGAEALTQAGLALGKIAELLVSAKNRKRPHRKLSQPTLPSLEKELP